jgi:hypothetical protein
MKKKIQIYHQLHRINVSVSICISFHCIQSIHILETRITHPFPHNSNLTTQKQVLSQRQNKTCVRRHHPRNMTSWQWRKMKLALIYLCFSRKPFDEVMVRPGINQGLSFGVWFRSVRFYIWIVPSRKLVISLLITSVRPRSY